MTVWRRLLRELLREVLSLLEGGPIGLVGQPTGASLAASGTVTAPAAAANVANFAAGTLGAGLWHLSLWWGYGSVAGLEDDFRFKITGATLFTCRQPAVINTAGPGAEVVILSDGVTTSATISVITGGVAGSLYKAQMIATPIRS